MFVKHFHLNHDLDLTLFLVIFFSSMRSVQSCPCEILPVLSSTLACMMFEAIASCSYLQTTNASHGLPLLPALHSGHQVAGRDCDQKATYKSPQSSCQPSGFPLVSSDCAENQDGGRTALHHLLVLPGNICLCSTACKTLSMPRTSISCQVNKWSKYLVKSLKVVI